MPTVQAVSANLRNNEVAIFRLRNPVSDRKHRKIQKKVQKLGNLMIKIEDLKSQSRRDQTSSERMKLNDKITQSELKYFRKRDHYDLVFSGQVRNTHRRDNRSRGHTV